MPLMIKLRTNQMAVTRLDNGVTISRTATTEFSSSRLVIAHFFKAKAFLQGIIKEICAN